MGNQWAHSNIIRHSWKRIQRTLIERSLSKVNYDHLIYQNCREQILASDGGTIVLDWHESKPPVSPDVTIVIVPGIASSSEACAIRHFVKVQLEFST
jgi:predicted alpha/beta-fold hydrolase